MIKANGRKNGKSMTVTYDNGAWKFNGKTDIVLQTEIEVHIEMRHPVGGTFYPEKDDILNYINVLRSYFFDRWGEVETDENVPTMESEKGVAY